MKRLRRTPLTCALIGIPLNLVALPFIILRGACWCVGQVCEAIEDLLFAFAGSCIEPPPIYQNKSTRRV